MKIVELCGAPGVGKSSLIRALGSSVVTRRELGPVRAHAHPEPAPGAPERWQSAACATIDRREAVLRDPRPDWFAEDHGMLQRAHWLLMLGSDAGMFLARMPLPDLAVFCVASETVIRERNIERARRVEGKRDSSAETGQAIEAAEIVLGAVNRRPGNALILDMEQPLDVNARLLGAIVTPTEVA